MVKRRISQLQKEIKDNLRIESKASLETNHTESWRKIKNFLKPKGQRDYAALRLNAKTAKTNADNSLPKVTKDTSALRVTTLIQATSMRSTKFTEGNYEYLYPPEDPDDYRSDMDDDHDLVADIDSDILIRIVKFLKRGKAPGPDNIHNEVLRLGKNHLIVPSLSKAFYLLHTNRLHPNCIEISYPSYVTET